MTSLSTAAQHTLCQLAQQLACAGHGGKGQLIAAACAQLNMSRPTLYRHLKAVQLTPERKQRADAGHIGLTRADAQTISAYLTPHLRGLGKQSLTLRDAVEHLRQNQLIQAHRLDASTGEILPLSTTAIARGLRHYGLHPQQLRQPKRARQQASLHPNHVWQMDASTCTLFYMDDDGSASMPESVFYKNKLQNFEKVAKKRVTRFVITDHTSGAIKVRYGFGGESIANFSEFFIWATQKQKDCPVHGVPFILMVDAGSGMAGAFKNLVRRLGIELIVNAPGNPRAKGQVENAQNLVEMGFEAQFRAQRPASLAQLNARAETWAAHYNATRTHTRHGKTRSAKWMEIQPHQLRTAPGIDVLRQCLTDHVKPCKVDRFERVRFGGQGRQWDVSAVPGVMVGATLDITYNAYNDAEVFAITMGEQGREVLHPCPLVASGEHGFAADANVIGAGYSALPETATDKARKKLAAIATGEVTAQAADKALRDKRRELFNGRIRFDHLQDELAQQPTFIGKRGTKQQPDVVLPAQTTRTRNAFEVAQWLTAQGIPASAERNARIKEWYPDGAVPEGELEQLKNKLQSRNHLQVVGGKAVGN